MLADGQDGFGDDVGQAMLRDFINATIGFEALAETTILEKQADALAGLGPRGGGKATRNKERVVFDFFG